MLCGRLLWQGPVQRLPSCRGQRDPVPIMNYPGSEHRLDVRTQIVRTQIVSTGGALLAPAPAMMSLRIAFWRKWVRSIFERSYERASK